MPAPIQKLLNTDMFSIVFSALLGIGLIAILHVPCKGEHCTVKKAPPVKEWDGAVYRIGADCYEYKASTIKCPTESTAQFIESFSQQRATHL